MSKSRGKVTIVIPSRDQPPQKKSFGALLEENYISLTLLGGVLVYIILGLSWAIVFFFAMALLRIYLWRSQILQGMRYVETLIWGRPLDKDMWQGNEWKNRKRRRFVLWKKKK